MYLIQRGQVGKSLPKNVIRISTSIFVSVARSSKYIFFYFYFDDGGKGANRLRQNLIRWGAIGFGKVSSIKYKKKL